MSGRNDKMVRRVPPEESAGSRWTAWRVPAYVLGGMTLLAVLILIARSSGPGGIAGPGIKFVGNETCAAAGASPFAETAPSANASPAYGQPIDEMPHTHINPPAKVTYLHDPPTSGCHYNLGYGQAPVTAGVYDQHLDPEKFVHNLEHGYVVVYYNCPKGCTDDVNKLKAWYKSLSSDPKGGTAYAKVLVLPWSSSRMQTKFGVASWDWYLPLDAVNIDQVQSFCDNHVDQSPEQNRAP